jgi:hypothetical protein
MNPRKGPPRSLYSELPERFCFQRTRRAPAMLRRDARLTEESVELYRLSLL